MAVALLNLHHASMQAQLRAAAFRGDVKAVQELIRLGAPLDEPDGARGAPPSPPDSELKSLRLSSA